LARYIGLDGFSGGWVSAWIEDNGRQGFDYSSSLNRLLSETYDRAMIDIPIGVPNIGFRHCDVQTREWLGPSVFRGARRGLWLFDSQGAANEHYWRYEGKGMGISCQLRNIRDKIKEVDDFITPERQQSLCETHPELVFWVRNGKKVLESKKSNPGRRRRIEILNEGGFKEIGRWIELRFGTGIGRDDLIDACACAIAARDSTFVIGDPCCDARGLRMEMHY
jgi:predicted RNase H-like nuclease